MIRNFLRLMLIVATFLLAMELAHSKVKRIIIHTTFLPKQCGARCIDIYHRIKRGWKSCGYHRVVRHTGAVEKCRDFGETGAHVRGFNKDSVGIAWAGIDKPTKKQMKSLIELTARLLKQFNLKPRDVFGHRYFPTANGKTCPDIDMRKFRREVYWELYGGR